MEWRKIVPSFHTNPQDTLSKSESTYYQIWIKLELI